MNEWPKWRETPAGVSSNRFLVVQTSDGTVAMSPNMVANWLYQADICYDDALVGHGAMAQYLADTRGPHWSSSLT